MQEEVAVDPGQAADLGGVAVGAADRGEQGFAAVSLVGFGNRVGPDALGASQGVDIGDEVAELLAVEVGWDVGIVVPDRLGLVEHRITQAHLVGASGGDKILQRGELGLPAKLADSAIGQDTRPPRGRPAELADNLLCDLGD